MIRRFALFILIAAALSLPLKAREECCAPGYIAGEAVIWFFAGTSQETVEAIALLEGARVTHLIGNPPFGPIYLIQTPIGQEAALVARFGTHEEVSHAQPSYSGCLPEWPACACCPCGFFCPSHPHCPLACAGAVSDGDFAPGTPLTIEHAPGGAIRLDWETACVENAADYEIYEGPIGSFDQHVPIACSTAGETTMTFAPSPGSVYYLVVPTNDLGEGSYGVDSMRMQRPASTSRCRPPALAVRAGCVDICGDGFRRGDESCDLADLGGETCATVGFDGGTLACSTTCEFVTTGCTTVCGDGVRQGNEECDGDDFGSATCATAGFDEGTLSCNGSCTIGTAGCTTVCGDGVRRGNEVCDGTDFGSSTCVTEGFDGGTLTCAATCDSFSTQNCAQCGDGVRHPSEQCDGADLGGQICANFGFTGGVLTCRPECTFNLGSCTFCGNNAREGSEVCDGTDLADQTCASQGFTGGSLGCNASCSDFNRSACTRCGNGVREAGEVCDGADLGGKSCESLGFSGGTLTCSASCLALNTSFCFN